MGTSCSLFLSLIAFMTLSISSSNSTCAINDDSYICKNIASKDDFPISLPANIHKVMLFGSNNLPNSIPGGLFRNATWANISELSILEFSAIESIEETFLDGLGKLKFLSISSCRELRKINPNVFNFTPNLEALHLNGNILLTLTEVETAITGKLEKLKFLSLKGIQSADRGVLLGENFSSAFRAKNITYLDLSELNAIAINQEDIQELLKNIKFLNVSYSTLFDPFSKNAKQYLHNLELIDLTNCIVMGEYAVRLQSKTFGVSPIENIIYIFAQRLVDQNVRVRYNGTYTVQNETLRKLKVLDLSKNNIIVINMSFSGKYIARALENLNLSDNSMEYISPTSLSYFPSLNILDLSKNQLHKMQNQEEFSLLFSENQYLEIIYLQNNDLSFLPLNLFSSNTRLRAIDLSENNFKYFYIDIHNTLHLQLIDLRRNQLNNMPAAFFKQLEDMHTHWDTAKTTENSKGTILLNHITDKDLISKAYTYGYNASDNYKINEQHMTLTTDYVTLNLLDNPLICDCDSLEFVQWILKTDISIVNRTQLTCTYDNKETLVNDDFLEILKGNCRFVQIFVTAMSLSVASIAGLSAIGIFLHLRRRKALRRQDFELLKRELLHNNTQFNFVVFLSYCSRDSHIVDNIIMPSLKSFLREIFNTQRELVCTGADHFVPGLHIIDEIHRCITESLVIVPVITPAFLESDWSQRECIDAIENHRQVVVLMEEQTNISFARRPIRQLIEQYTRASWMYNDGIFSIRPSWNTVFSAILQTSVESFRQHRLQHDIANIESFRTHRIRNDNEDIELVSLIK